MQGRLNKHRQHRPPISQRLVMGMVLVIVGVLMIAGLSAVMFAVALRGHMVPANLTRFLAVLLGIGVLVTALGMVLALRVARTVVRPLEELAQAAHRMGRGDMQTPIHANSNLLEIRRLARVLDRSRQRLLRAHRATRREKKRMEQLLEATGEGIVLCDEAGHILAMNANAEQLLGIEEYEVFYKSYRALLRPAPGQPPIDLLIQPPEGAPLLDRITVLDRQDRPLTLQITTSWMSRQPSEEQQERVIVLRDISEEAAVADLQSSFLANVSHEFRTPLAAMIATTEILHEEGENLTKEELSELLSAIHMGTLKLQTLIDNLLESANIEAGSFRVRPQPIDLNEIIAEASQTMTPLLRRREQLLEVDGHRNVPQVEADPVCLHQVLLNLLANASKFSPMQACLKIKVREVGEALRVSVLDTGPGLPAGRYADLFKRFVKGGDTSSAQYGVGLGLSVVKAIVDAHGGQVGAANRAEGGAEVWFSLPFSLSGRQPDHMETNVVVSGYEHNSGS